MCCRPKDWEIDVGRKKLLEILGNIFDMKANEREKKKKELKQVLRKLKGKEAALIEKLKHEKDKDKREKLQQKIDILHAQRKKGLVILKEQH